MKKQIVLILFLLIATFLSGCGDTKTNPTEKKSDGKLNIYTTVYPLQYFTEEIGGKYVNVETIYPPGTDEHSYEPSQKDIIKMAESDLFFYIGYNLEGFVTKAKPILTDEGVKTLAVGETVDLETTTAESHAEEAHEEDDGHHHGDVDPHLWLDPIYATQMAKTIKDELTSEMPEQAKYFEAQYKKLASDLKNLDQQLADTIQNGKTKKIIVSHSAYGYWEKRYGLKQISVTGLTGSSEPSQKDLETIVKTAKEHNLHYVIFEQNVSSKLTAIIQKEIGAKSLKLHNLATLTDKDINKGATYMSLMEQNINILNTALNN